MGKLAGYDFKGGTVLVYFLKKKGRMDEEKKGQTKPEMWP
jgi:hypothetical protein